MVRPVFDPYEPHPGPGSRSLACAAPHGRQRAGAGASWSSWGSLMALAIVSYFWGGVDRGLSLLPEQLSGDPVAHVARQALMLRST